MARKAFLCALVGLAWFLTADQTVHAGVLASFMDFGGAEPTSLVDESRGMAVNFDGAEGDTGFAAGNTLTVGDVIYGLINIDDINNVGVNNPPSIVALYALQVTDVDLSGADPVLSFGVVAGADDAVVNNGSLFAGLSRDDFTLFSILEDLGFSAATLTTFLADWSDVGVVVLESTTAGTPLAINESGDLNGDSILRDPANFGPGVYSLALAAGFSTVDDFFEFAVTNPTVAQLSGLRAQGTGAAFGDFGAGLSVLAHNFGPGIDFNPIEAEHMDGSITEHDMVVVDGGANGVRKATAPVADREWMLTDNADILIHPTPEPGTIVVWGAFALCVGASRLRRRRNRV